MAIKSQCFKIGFLSLEAWTQNRSIEAARMCWDVCLCMCVCVNWGGHWIEEHIFYIAFVCGKLFHVPPESDIVFAVFRTASKDTNTHRHTLWWHSSAPTGTGDRYIILRLKTLQQTKTMKMMMSLRMFGRRLVVDGNAGKGEKLSIFSITFHRFFSCGETNFVARSLALVRHGRWLSEDGQHYGPWRVSLKAIGREKF